MVDRDLVLKKLAFIETRVRELQTLARLDLLESDIREERFVVHTLQLAAQAAIDVASHIVSDDRLGEPRTNAELFELLHRAGWLGPDLTRAMRNLAGFRNIVVHGYEDVALGVVRDIVRDRLPDLLGFAAAIGDRLGRR
ncbi:MAG: DUF86 domain-containing protein [Propionivibrio sp.]|jgi:uncharacterized protein YutE (UPF0331/DUF86 family)|nr:DUF86 domain-containing protein [Propionivibrio sp.]